MTERKPSLREQILAANSEQEIDELLSVGASYQFASNQTRKRWQATAKRRRTELTANGKSTDTGVAETPVEPQVQ